MMDQITAASPADFQRVRSLLRSGRHVFADFGSEDLGSLLEHGLAVVGSADDQDWGALLIQRWQKGAATPPSSSRAMLRGLVLSPARSPVVDVPRLVEAANEILAEDDSLQVVLYATQDWLVTPLLQAGFVLDDRLHFVRLTNLHQRTLPHIEPPEGVTLRPAAPDDVADLALLDVSAFDPIWRMDKVELMTLLISGRLQLAEKNGKLLGYSALSMLDEGRAHLARLAVHPHAQGQGIGRALLHDAVLFARASLVRTFLLNTQGSNTRAQTLYHHYGFRATGQVVPVLTKILGNGNR